MHRSSKAQEFRGHAEDCRLQAERCSTEIEKEHWRKMAADWLRMARDADIWGIRMRASKNKWRRSGFSRSGPIRDTADWHATYRWRCYFGQ